MDARTVKAWRRRGIPTTGLGGFADAPYDVAAAFDEDPYASYTTTVTAEAGTTPSVITEGQSKFLTYALAIGAFLFIAHRYVEET
jgi:hypothetical protein